eukprot:TRINITY_DN16523_c0_g3_i2.p1 TRINITY_DN16523_c0_g3~~TRINITY_DN16523_c0_g3_i2.p1  ORF type:complete len:271 (-),score=29.84 TRINITY_DN16523_c0_g3_i2:173-952(-)
MASEPVMGCASTACVGLIINAVVLGWRRRVMERRKNDESNPHPLFAEVEASQIWCYFFSMSLQAVIYPLCVLADWGKWSTDGRGGLFVPHRSGNDLFGLRCFLYVFFGYLSRDIWMSSGNLMIVAHHALCMAGILSVLNAPEGGVPGVLGMFSLELGSLLYNTWLIDDTMRALPNWIPFWPRSESFKSIIPAMFKVGFTISNIVAFRMLGLATYVNASEGHWGYAIFFGLGGLPLLFLRQKECMTAMKPGSAMDKSSKK